MTVQSTAQPNLKPASSADWRERLVVNFLRAVAIYGLLALIPAVQVAYQQQQWGQIALYCIAYLIALTIALAPVPYRLRATITIGLIFVLGIDALNSDGLRGAASIYLFAFTMMTLILFNFRLSLLAFGVSTLSILFFGALINAGTFVPTAPDAMTPTWWNIIDSLTTFTLLNIPVIVGINWLQREFSSTQERESKAMEQLALEREQLERNITERTRTVERRTIQLATGAEIARVASAELDQTKLLNEVVKLIQARFQLYYVGVFLVDDSGKFAVLQAGTGEPGQAMLANKHKLEVGGQSMIGQATSDQQARIALDVGQEAVRFNNPYLPRTRSEMALPLVARNHTVGALTIQSEQPTAFSPEDIVSLQGMADLIAIALDNARLFQNAQHSLEEVNRLHQGYITQAWSNAEGGTPTYVYADQNFSRGEPVIIPNLEQVTNEKKAIVSGAGESPTFTIPIRLRDQVIGAISIEDDSPDRVWSPEELTLVESVLEQAALSLENARLLQETESALSETRRLADREQTVNTISNKIRRLPSVESVLTTALVELGRTLGASRGLVRLGASTRPIAELEERHE